MAARVHHRGHSLAIGAIATVTMIAVAPESSAEEAAAVVVAGIPLTDPGAGTLHDQVRAGLARRGDIQVVDPEIVRSLFAHPPPADRTEIRARAGALLDQAHAELRSFQVTEAQATLGQATALLEADFGLAAALDLDRKRLALAVEVAHALRDETALDRALNSYAARFGKQAPPAGQWPPDIVRRVAAVAARAQTKLRISSEPAGHAFVDGRQVGVTPVEVDALTAGRHRVEVRAEGHFASQAWVKTDSTKLAQVHLELPPTLSVRVPRIPAEGPLSDDLRAAISAAGRRAGADLVFIAAPALEGRVSMRIIEVGTAATYGPEVSDSVKGALQQAWAARASAHAGRIAGARGPVWPWIVGAAGVAAVGAGVGVRMWARDTQGPLEVRRGALTQSEAFAVQSRAEDRANVGTALIAVGATAAATAIAGLIWDLLDDEGQTP